MKRLRGACKGCKCAVPLEFRPEWECMAAEKFKIIKKPPKRCEKRIDAETYLQNGGQGDV